MLLLIDNHDSFTYNIVQYLRTLGATVKVVMNDELTVQEIAALQPERLVLSPGPGTPDEAGVSLAAVEYFAGRIPILGVCLGHQVIGQVFGGTVRSANSVKHGKTSALYHCGKELFDRLPQGYQVTRYHSLVVARDTLPSCLEETAWTQDATNERDEIMGLQHRTLDIHGVQFHPESIMTEHGHALLQNFLVRSAH